MMSTPELPNPSALLMLEFADTRWRVRRPKPFVLVIEGELGDEGRSGVDYLHDKLLAPPWREAFYQLVDATGLVVCLNLHTEVGTQALKVLTHCSNAT